MSPDEHMRDSRNQPAALADIFVIPGKVVLMSQYCKKHYCNALLASLRKKCPYKQTKRITDEELENELYSVFLTKGVLESSEIMPDGFVPRAEAVKYLLRAVGYKNVAELEGIFKIPFMDAHKIPPSHYGYIALARGMGLISGSGGYFYPSQNLTNADALILIYNYLRYNN